MVIIPRGKTARLIVKSMTLMREENEPWNTDLFYACRKSFIYLADTLSALIYYS
jgi:hypothetical protein